MAEEEKKSPSAESQDDALMDLLFEEEEGTKEEASPEVDSKEEAKEETASGKQTKEEAPPAGAEGKSGEEKDSQDPVKEETKDLTGPEEDPLAEILGEEGPEEAEKPPSEDTGPEGAPSGKKAPLKEEVPPEEKDPGEEAEEDTEEESPKKKVIFLVLALLVPLVFILAGLFVFWHLYHQTSLPPAAKRPSKTSPVSQEQEAPLVSSPIAVEGRKILFLKDFLIPYRRETGEFVFVKAKVFLYFANRKDYELAKKNELLLREEIYRLFRNAPLYVWENKKGAKIVKKELKEYLQKKKIGGVSPVDLEVTGYILE